MGIRSEQLGQFRERSIYQLIVDVFGGAAIGVGCLNASNCEFLTETTQLNFLQNVFEKKNRYLVTIQ